MPRVRFTLRSMMAAVAAIAGLLALPTWLQQFVAVVSLPCLAIFSACRLVAKRRRRLAAVCFWTLAILANVLFAVISVYPGMISVLLLLAWCVIFLPTLAGFGVAWAVAATPEAAAQQSPRRGAWAWVVALSVMPGITAWTAWPFHLAFLSARASLEQLADQVEAGQAISFPQSLGPFEIVASRIDARTGGIALLTDPNPSGPSGFVRHKGLLIDAYRFNCYAPIRGDWWHVGLGDGWCYHEED